MKTVHQADRDTYRLIVVGRDASEILFASSGSGLSLPTVEVFPQQRTAHQLTSELNRQWSLQAYCLFVPRFVSSDKNTRRENYAVLESIEENAEPPSETCWLPRTASLCRRTHPFRDSDAISESLRELDSYVSESKAGPFGRPGWLRELFTWSQEQLTPLGLRLNGSFSQFNASPTFSLIRLDTNGPFAWFKATGEPNRHELPITVLLARLFPAYLPAILGVHPSWNAWLSEGIADTTLDQCTELSTWERVAENLAELQIASMGKCCDLLDAKCRDLRLSKLIDLIPAFFARMSEFMAVQQEQSSPALTNGELSFLANRLGGACSLLCDLNFPDTLGHIDFNPGNILVSPPRCHFLDWAEACVANPLITFEYLREHMQRSFANDAAAFQKISASYVRRWQSLLSPDDLEQALAVSPLIAIFAYAVSSDAWSSPETIHTPSMAGCFRSLTRRMHREAMYQSQRSEPCPV